MLSERNVEFLNDMKLGLFNPFFKESKLYNMCIQLSRFEDIAYNLKNSVGKLHNQEVECNYRFSLCDNTPIQNSPNNSLNTIYPPELINFRKQIVTDTAKLQEFVRVKLIDLENISTDFYDRKSSKHRWDTIKSNLLSQIENITKGQ